MSSVVVFDLDTFLVFVHYFDERNQGFTRILAGELNIRNLMEVVTYYNGIIDVGNDLFEKMVTIVLEATKSSIYV